MAVTQYIGARYVPLLATPHEWDSTREYEPLTIVLHQGASYTSLQYVPVGIDILNERYWVLTGNYNAQVESYRQEVRQFQGRLSNVEDKATELESEIDEETTTRETADIALNGRITDETNARVAAVTDETNARVAADSELSGAIATESTARTEADSAINASIAAEVEARTTADTNLDNRISSVSSDVSSMSRSIESIQNRIRIGSFFTNPVYKGSFTAYNGYCQDAQGKRKPYLQQGMTYTENSNFAFFLCDGNYNITDVWVGNTNKPSSKSDTVNNRIGVVASSINGLGHANCVEYDPSTRRYYVITGESQRAIVELNSDFTPTGRVKTFPPIAYPDTFGSGYGAVLHDRKNGSWYAVQGGNGRIFTFDTENMELTATGNTINVNRVNQGMALYDNVLVCIYDGGGDTHDYSYELQCYNITNGDYIATFSLPETNSHYPLGEIEDLSFTDDGILYMASLLRYEGALDYCGTVVLSCVDIFQGKIGYDAKRNNYTQPPIVYMEPKYNGFFSNGTYDYPVKTLDELSQMLVVLPKTRTVKCGLESGWSQNTGAEEWFGFLQLTGVQCTIQFNSDNHATIMGGIIARDNTVLKIRNKTQLKGWFGQSGQAYIRADDSIVLAQDIQCIENNASGATTFTGVFDIPGTGMLWAKSVNKPSSLNLTKSVFNGGFGYVIGNPKSGAL